MEVGGETLRRGPSRERREEERKRDRKRVVLAVTNNDRGEGGEEGEGKREREEEGDGESRGVRQRVVSGREREQIKNLKKKKINKEKDVCK